MGNSYLNGKLVLSDCTPAKIMYWIAPDWSKKRDLPIGEDNIITQPGWIFMRNINYRTALHGTINGQIVFDQFGSAEHFQDWNSFMCPVMIGDVVNLSGGEAELIFIPMYGAEG